MTSGENHQRKIRVAVVFGGRSDEHDVSLRSARTIMDALDPAKYEIVPVGITREGRWVSGDDPMGALIAVSPMFALTAGEEVATTARGREVVPVTGAEALMPGGVTEAVDVFFPALHGPMGEDGTIQGMLEMAGLPYVGSGVLGSAASMDKAMTKVVLTQAGIPQLPWMLLLRRDWERDADSIETRIIDEIGFPCFVKPANLGSSVGISKAKNADELHTALREAALFDRRIVVEKGVTGRELELSVLGNDDPIVSVAGEIRPKGEFYDYNAKYIDDTAELVIPAELDPDIQKQLEDYAARAFLALDLAGLARVDFFLEDGTNQIYLNEVNTLPGFTSISMYPSLWAASGVPIEELVDRLVQLALERHAEK
ncbi:MAG TPA: D-alanine--D-alanine ligase family protein [Thermomicrobiales bacterium]|nr:D-alanine--D-alanine ligase family protein [Thermomicrobiales bacterium]